MFLFIVLSCISVVCAINVNESSNADMSTTVSANYDNNLKQDMDEDLYDDEIIPDNNFEDGMKMLGASLNTEGRYVLRASLQINMYNSFKEMVIQETTGIGWSNLVDFGYSYFGLKTSN